MKLFYECNLFDKDKELSSRFSVVQRELSLKEQISLENFKFEYIDITYDCSWDEQKNWNSKLPTLLIPTKDSKGLIRHTFNNLEEKGILESTNVILIDDRSEEDLKSICSDFSVSYLRVDNDKGFNFSMLNNIAAWICHKKGVREIVLWNSDVWCENGKWFDELIVRHRKNKNVMTGTKLLYPSLKMSYNKTVDTENITRHFPSMSDGSWREKVQFGGASYHSNGLPGHRGRFSNKEDKSVDVDESSVPFITGAFQIIDLSTFISCGGLNPSLARNFQDVELCDKISSHGKIAYYGKGIYFYHDESPTLMREGKYNSQMTSDQILYKKILSSRS